MRKLDFFILGFIVFEVGFGVLRFFFGVFVDFDKEFRKFIDFIFEKYDGILEK